MKLQRAMKQNGSFEYPGALLYMMALYSFYAIIMSAWNMVKVRKYASPAIAAARRCNHIHTFPGNCHAGTFWGEYGVPAGFAEYHGRRGMPYCAWDGSLYDC